MKAIFVAAIVALSSQPALGQSGQTLKSPEELFGNRAAPQAQPGGGMFKEAELDAMLFMFGPRTIVLTSGVRFRFLADTPASILLDAALSCEQVMQSEVIRLSENRSGGAVETLTLSSNFSRLDSVTALIEDQARREGTEPDLLRSLRVIHMNALERRPEAAPTAAECRASLYPVFFRGL